MNWLQVVSCVKTHCRMSNPVPDLKLKGLQLHLPSRLHAALQDVEGAPTAPGALRVLAAMLLLVGTVLGAVMAQLRRAGAAPRPVSPRQAASTCGLLVSPAW